MADLGTDFSGVIDLDARLSTVSGREALAQACARRLRTAPGRLFYDLGYGIDLAAGVGRAVKSTAMLEARAEQELLKDERVENASVSMSLDQQTGVLTTTITLTDSAGPFTFVLPVGSVTSQLLLGP